MQTGKIWLSLLTLIATSTASIGAFAADDTTGATPAAESKMTVEDAKDAKNKTPGQDVDEVITNNKMRAESGSKSKWSVSTALNYNGSTIAKPLAESRPNISSGPALTDKAAIEGTIQSKYNFNSEYSLAAGAGVRWVAPLKSGTLSNYDGSRFDASNPQLTFQRVYKWSGIQSVLQVIPLWYTYSDLVRQGNQSNLVISQENLYEVGHTGLSLGIFAYATGATFSHAGAFGNPKDKDDFIADLQTRQSDYGGGIDPYMEYAINDRINLRTVSNLWNYDHFRADKRFWGFKWEKVNQSVGVGISVTRDIFLYPNVQFLPENIRADRTNVALNTNINMF